MALIMSGTKKSSVSECIIASGVLSRGYTSSLPRLLDYVGGHIAQAAPTLITIGGACLDPGVYFAAQPADRAFSKLEGLWKLATSDGGV
jgi:hypothetical protein